MAYNYKGVLKKPMIYDPQPRNVLVGNSPLDFERERERLEEEHSQRIDALAKDCGAAVPPSDIDAWMDIALALARRHVPGFAIKGADRSRALKANQRKYFMYQMRRLVRGGMSIRNAAERVARAKDAPNKGGLDSEYRRTFSKKARQPNARRGK